MKKLLKKVTTEYYEEYSDEENLRRVKRVTTVSKWVGSSKDPIVSTTFEYL